MTMAIYTIGEVLNQLREDFADVTISRIRHLEAHGLISPDRTESGYRKFSEHDLERLRYALTAIRDRQLSVEVIRRELDEAARMRRAPSPSAAPELAETPNDFAEAADQDPPDAERIDLAHDDASGPLQLTLGQEHPQVPEAAVQRNRGGTSSPTTVEASVPPDNAPDPHWPAPPVGEIGPFVDEVGDFRLTDSELADQAGLTVDDVKQLREHGILGREALFDSDDVRTARVAGQLLAFGLEARHLRMFRQFAQRQAGLIEQLMLPHLRQRNPDSRDHALATSQQLSDLGAELQRRLLDEEIAAALRSWR